jgi:hypothetical protein
MLRDAEVAHAIRPVVERHNLTPGETRDALVALGVPRADGIAKVVTLNASSPQS